jgi:MFS family permease
MHFAIPLYAASTFLSKYVETSSVGLIYSLMGILSLIFTFYLGRFVKIHHSYNTAMMILITGFISTISLSFLEDKVLIITAFIISNICSFLFFSVLNLFIEEFDTDGKTGETRGIFLTLLNSGILFSALFAGQILSISSFSVLWIVSACCLIPIMFLIKHNYANVRDPKFKNPNMFLAIKHMTRDKNLFAVFVSILVLECFFVSMAIYAPTVLQNNLNINIDRYLSVILPFALIPFVIFPYQLGIIADKKYGEKEMLLTGISILIMISLIFPNITNMNIFLIAIFLFISRVGAALVESMCTIYFYKKVKADDISIIALFSSTRVIAYIFMPLISSIILSSGLSITYVFYALAIFFLYSVYKAKDLVDTK